MRAFVCVAACDCVVAGKWDMGFYLLFAYLPTARGFDYYYIGFLTVRASGVTYTLLEINSRY